MGLLSRVWSRSVWHHLLDVKILPILSASSCRSSGLVTRSLTFIRQPSMNPASSAPVTRITDISLEMIAACRSFRNLLALSRTCLSRMIKSGFSSRTFSSASAPPEATLIRQCSRPVEHRIENTTLRSVVTASISQAIFSGSFLGSRSSLCRCQNTKKSYFLQELPRKNLKQIFFGLEQ